MRLPTHSKTRENDYQRRGTSFWAASPAINWQPPQIYGQYPRGFIPWACRVMGARRESMLHVCSGALPPGEGIRVDIAPERKPDYVADGRSLPFANSAFPAAMIDPPYTEQYAKDLYGTDYPRPSHLLAEALRVIEPGGVIGFLHFIVPIFSGGSIERIYGITQGAGYAARAFTVIRKRPADLFDGGSCEAALQAVRSNG